MNELTVNVYDRSAELYQEWGNGRIFCASNDTNGVNRDFIGGKLGMVTKFAMAGVRDTAIALCNEMGFEQGQTSFHVLSVVNFSLQKKTAKKRSFHILISVELSQKFFKL